MRVNLNRKIVVIISIPKKLYSAGNSGGKKKEKLPMNQNKQNDCFICFKKVATNNPGNYPVLLQKEFSLRISFIYLLMPISGMELQYFSEI